MNFTIEAPKRKTIVMVFDVETTGLLPKKDKSNPLPLSIDSYPHILQLSYALYNISTHKVIETYDTYIKVKRDVEISEKITELTGATREKCNNGTFIIDALHKFYQAYMKAEIIVAHNNVFDRKLIEIEIERNREQIIKRAPACMTIFNPTYEEIHNIEHYCTMRKGTTITNIVLESKFAGKPPSLKWPNLQELYKKLFDNESVDGLHNSMVDVLVCLRCYMKMRHNYDCGLITNK